MTTTVVPQITFLAFPPSPALEHLIHDRVAWLQQVNRDITACRVLIDVPHRRHHSGPRFLVRIELTVPGVEPVVVTHEAPKPEAAKGETAYEDAYAAVRAAFAAARRRLQDVTAEQRGFVKAHSL